MAAPVDMSKWKGLFEWSMKYQDGARSSEHSPEALTPEKKAWLDQALQDYMKDFVDRMKEIKDVLSTDDSRQTTAAAGANTAGAPEGSSKGATLAEKEALCDELMDIVANVDYAKDLHKIGGLSTLLSLMSSPHPSLRWRAAEIAATCMANNPPVQRWFMEGQVHGGGALQPLLQLLSDSNTVAQTKAVLALSALVRHFDQGLEAFRLAGGLQMLLGLLGCPTDSSIAESEKASAAAGPQPQQQKRLQRKVLALLQYMLMKHPADCLASAEFGAAGPLRALLADTDSDMRQAALSVLLEICSNSGGWEWVKQHEHGLVEQLQQLQQQHKQLSSEDQEAEQEEGQLLGQLLSLLQSAHAPAPAADGGSEGLKDHVDVDPYQDGGPRTEKTLNIRQPQQEGQQTQQQHEQQQPSVSLPLMAVPKPELR